ncbi:unnamed protein product [Ceratitis capitata]|uniref:(Mediterranean fruit fly) hypothetical protein n=1 Tax=Ceratitis capitata TaxID=7213 RepID=A0A811UYU7_CERCA|nr:unnamed protein product [Ceratitis capitata]
MTAWTSAGLQPTTGYYSYDPMSAYGYGPSYDLAARRKNATRESTATLKAWLNEHKKNPYPTKGEKIMLAIITKMTLTQVSTWFANARRRLKKENKMTWEPKNRTDDDDEAMASDDEKEKDELESEKSSQGLHGVNIGGGGQRKELDKDDDDLHDEESKSLGSHASDLRSAGIGYSGGSVGGAPGGGYHAAVEGTSSHPHSYHPYHHQHPAYYQHQQALLAASGYPTSGMPGSNSNINNNNNNNINKHDGSDPKNQLSRDCGVPIPASKPKIWSLADTVACKTPPPAQAAAYMGQAQQQQQQHAMQQAHMNSSGMGNHMGLSQQQQLQPQQQMGGPPPATHMMMSNYGVGTAYSRAPPTTAYGGFLGATMQQLHTTNNIPYNNNNSSSTNSNNNNHNSNHHHNNNNNSSSSSSSNIINNNNNNVPAHTNTIPTNTRTMANTTAQQLAAGTVAPPHPPSTHMRPSSHNNPSAAHHPYGAAQRGMGFPEAQPDTPPQTPPNMKQQSVAANLLLTASQIPTIATYRNNGNAGVGGSLNSSGGVYGHSNGMPAGYAMNYSTRYDEYSPRDESSSGSSSCSSADSPRLQSNDGPYKASFKSQQIAGFVSPV